MYWSAEGVIERAELDGSNRRKVTELGVNFFGDVIDAKGLTLDVDNNRLYFVSYHLYSLLYIDLSSTQLRLRPVHTLIRQFWLFYGPYGIAVDDEYVYWSENLVYGYVFRRSKNVHDGDVRVVVSGTYEPKGIAVKKGNFTQNSKYCISVINIDLSFWYTLNYPRDFNNNAKSHVQAGAHITQQNFWKGYIIHNRILHVCVLKL